MRDQVPRQSVGIEVDGQTLADGVLGERERRIGTGRGVGSAQVVERGGDLLDHLALEAPVRGLTNQPPGRYLAL